MGGMVEGVIAALGLVAGVTVALMFLVAEEAPTSGPVDQSHQNACTIRPKKERVAA